MFLRGVMSEPLWLKEVAVRVVDGAPRVVVVLTFDDVMVRRCLPTAVNGIQVEVQVA